MSVDTDLQLLRFKNSPIRIIMKVPDEGTPFFRDTLIPAFNRKRGILPPPFLGFTSGHLSRAPGRWFHKVNAGREDQVLEV